MFHYRFVTSLHCSRLQLSPLLFFASLICLQGSIVSLSIWCVTVLVFNCSIFCLLPHYRAYYFCKVSIVSLPVCNVIALSSPSAVSSSFCYTTILFLQGFQCLIICLLRHCSVLGFGRCPISSSFNFVTLSITSLYYFRLLLFHLLFVTQLYYFFKVSIVS